MSGVSQSSLATGYRNTLLYHDKSISPPDLGHGGAIGHPETSGHHVPLTNQATSHDPASIARQYDDFCRLQMFPNDPHDLQTALYIGHPYLASVRPDVATLSRQRQTQLSQMHRFEDKGGLGRHHLTQAVAEAYAASNHVSIPMDRSLPSLAAEHNISLHPPHLPTLPPSHSPAYPFHAPLGSHGISCLTAGHAPHTEEYTLMTSATHPVSQARRLAALGGYANAGSAPGCSIDPTDANGKILPGYGTSISGAFRRVDMSVRATKASRGHSVGAKSRLPSSTAATTTRSRPKSRAHSRPASARPNHASSASPFDPHTHDSTSYNHNYDPVPMTASAMVVARRRAPAPRVTASVVDAHSRVAAAGMVRAVGAQSDLLRDAHARNSALAQQVARLQRQLQASEAKAGENKQRVAQLEAALGRALGQRAAMEEKRSLSPTDAALARMAADVWLGVPGGEARRIEVLRSVGLEDEVVGNSGSDGKIGVKGDFPGADVAVLHSQGMQTRQTERVGHPGSTATPAANESSYTVYPQKNISSNQRLNASSPLISAKSTNVSARYDDKLSSRSSTARNTQGTGSGKLTSPQRAVFTSPRPTNKPPSTGTPSLISPRPIQKSMGNVSSRGLPRDTSRRHSRGNVRGQAMDDDGEEEEEREREKGTVVRRPGAALDSAGLPCVNAHTTGARIRVNSGLIRAVCAETPRVDYEADMWGFGDHVLSARE